MALRLVGLSVRACSSYHQQWFQNLASKAKTPDDMNTVGALGSVFDYYGQSTDTQEMASKNNFEVNWDDWSHLMTPGIVDKLKAKLDAIDGEDYETAELADSATVESDELKKVGHFLTWNGTLHKDYYDEQARLLENLAHAQPLDTMNYWEFKSMYKYEDVSSRWDQELGWYMPNNDQTAEDVCTANMFQFQKDLGKVALQRYTYDFIGRHQIIATVGKLSQTEKVD